MANFLLERSAAKLRSTRRALIGTGAAGRRTALSLRPAVTQQIDDDQAYDDAVAQFIEDVDSKAEWTIS